MTDTLERPAGPTLGATGRSSLLAAALGTGPWLLLLALCAYQMIVWSAGPLLVARGLHVNILQIALWGREWLVVSYKHPNLPGLVFEIAARIFGNSALLAYVLSQLFVTATLLVVFGQAREILKDRWQAAVATALLPSLIYFSVPSLVFNHNVAQMPFWAAFIWLFGRALDRRTSADWVLVAVVAALGMYVKLSMVLLLGLAALWLLLDARGRSALRQPSLWIALGVFILCLVPLLVAIDEAGFQVFKYAGDRASQGPQPLPLLAIVFALLVSPVIALLVARVVSLRDIPALLWRRNLPRNQLFLLWFTITPLLLCGAAAFRYDVRALWLTPMFSMWPVYLVGNLPCPCRPEQAWRTAGVAVAISLAALIGYGGYFGIANRFAEQPLRWEDWPQKELAAALQSRWHAEVPGVPLRIVGGPEHLSAAVGFWASDAPSLFEELDPSLSPWITPQRIARDGMLIVWQPEAFSGPKIDGWTSRYKDETLDMRWSGSAAARPVTVHYLIVPPASGGSANAGK